MKVAAFHLRKEISEHDLPFCFPHGQQEITQTEPGARVRKLSCNFRVGFGASLTVLFDISPAFVLQVPRAVGAPFVHSVLVLLLPLWTYHAKWILTAFTRRSSVALSH